MGKTVLVTGAARQLGGRFARHVGRAPEVDRVIAVDTRRPARPLGGAEFVRADIREPAIVEVLAGHGVDTVVHLDVYPSVPGHGGGRAAAKEANVLGTLQLLGACQRTPGLARVVVRSSTRVYGGTSRDPAVFTEDSPPASPTRGGFAQDVAEIEEYVRGFARRRPDVAVTVLRFADVLGPAAESSLASYLRLPVLPTVFGFDPRLQVVHEDDVLDVLVRAVRETGRGAVPDGTFNVAGDGVVLLSQAARRLGRPTVPVPRSASAWLGPGLGALGLPGLSAGQLRSLVHGAVVRTDRLREVMGRPLEYATAETFRDFAMTCGPGLMPPDVLAGAVSRIEGALRRG